MLRMNKAWIARMVGFLVISLAWSTVSAVTLQGIEFSSLPGDRTEIRMHFDAIPPTPNGYTIARPARIVLDLPGVVSALDEKHHNLGIGNARRVSVIGTKDRTRAIVNLTELVAYETDVKGNTLYLLVGSGIAAGEVAPRRMVSADEQRVSSASNSASISDVDFRRGSNGEGRVIFKISNPKVPVDVSSDGGKIRVEVRNTDLPSNLQRRLDVTDFATPVEIVDALQEGPHTVFTIVANGNYDYLAYQADGTMSIDVTPLTEQEAVARDDIFKFTGEKLSLNFQDIEVRSVL